MIHEGESRAAKLFIKRTQPTTDETPPWRGISFLLPVGSDRLADQLKHAFSDCKTLRQRKHKAAILFLERELEEMKVSDEEQYQHPDAPDAPDNHQLGSPQSESIEILDRRSVGSTQQNTSTSSCTSPITPDSARSPKLADRSRSQYPHPGLLQSPTANTITTAQTFVFSAVDGRPLQPKTKRKMTSDERVVYKQTRKRGACDKCKRQKGKCTHGNNAESTDSRQVANRNSPTPDQAPLSSAGALKTEEIVVVQHQSLETYRNVNRPTDAQLTTHEERSTPANIDTSFDIESLPQHSERWGTSVEREREVDPLYVHTHQLPQEHRQIQVSSMQGSEWSFTGENFDPVYTGVASSPSRSFHSSLSPTIGHNDFHFSPNYDPWMDT